MLPYEILRGAYFPRSPVPMLMHACCCWGENDHHLWISPPPVAREPECASLVKDPTCSKYNQPTGPLRETPPRSQVNPLKGFSTVVSPCSHGYVIGRWFGVAYREVVFVFLFLLVRIFYSTHLVGGSRSSWRRRVFLSWVSRSAVAVSSPSRRRNVLLED